MNRCDGSAEVLGGKGGGGRPDLAQAGGTDGTKAEAAIEAIAELLAASGGSAQSGPERRGGKA